jgi:dihydroneopterin triphosphate diphosphatase
MVMIRADWINAYIFRKISSHDVEVLLLHRANDEAIYPGLWQVVTGGVEPGETAYFAAKREIEEETGIVATELIVMPYVGSFYNPKMDAIEMLPSFAYCLENDCNIVLSHEHQDYRWLHADDASDALVFPGQKEGIRILREFIAFPRPDYPLTIIHF